MRPVGIKNVLNVDFLNNFSFSAPMMIANKHNDYVYFELDFIHTFYIILLFI